MALRFRADGKGVQKCSRCLPSEGLPLCVDRGRLDDSPIEVLQNGRDFSSSFSHFAKEKPHPR